MGREALPLVAFLELVARSRPTLVHVDFAQCWSISIPWQSDFWALYSPCTITILVVIYWHSHLRYYLLAGHTTNTRHRPVVLSLDHYASWDPTSWFGCHSFDVPSRRIQFLITRVRQIKSATIRSTSSCNSLQVSISLGEWYSKPLVDLLGLLYAS